jgi:hypothetical protein
METFSKLARQLSDLGVEAERRRFASKPPPLGAKPVPKRRYILVPRDLVGGKVTDQVPEKRQAADASLGVGSNQDEAQQQCQPANDSQH